MVRAFTNFEISNNQMGDKEEPWMNIRFGENFYTQSKWDPNNGCYVTDDIFFPVDAPPLLSHEKTWMNTNIPNPEIIEIRQRVIEKLKSYGIIDVTNQGSLLMKITKSNTTELNINLSLAQLSGINKSLIQRGKDSSE